MRVNYFQHPQHFIDKVRNISNSVHKHTSCTNASDYNKAMGKWTVQQFVIAMMKNTLLLYNGCYCSVDKVENWPGVFAVLERTHVPCVFAWSRYFCLLIFI